MQQYAVYATVSDFADVGGLAPVKLVSPSTSSARVEGLTSGVPYYFAVTSINLSSGEFKTVTTVSAVPLSDAVTISGLATIAHPADAYTTSLPGPGDYRFGLRAVDAVGNEEQNTDLVATLSVTGFSVTVAVENDTYDRGQDVPVTGSVNDSIGQPLVGLPVSISIRSSGGTRRLHCLYQQHRRVSLYIPTPGG